METVFVLTHLIMMLCIGILCFSISPRNISERDLKQSVERASNLKPHQSAPSAYYKRIISYLAASQNGIIIIFNINNPKT
jgi:hypothetical protein